MLYETLVYILISLCIRRASILKQEFEFNSFIVDNEHVLLNITFGFDMPIRLLMNKIYLVNSDMSHLIDIVYDPNSNVVSKMTSSFIFSSMI